GPQLAGADALRDRDGAPTAHGPPRPDGVDLRTVLAKTRPPPPEPDPRPSRYRHRRRDPTRAARRRPPVLGSLSGDGRAPGANPATRDDALGLHRRVRSGLGLRRDAARRPLLRRGLGPRARERARDRRARRLSGADRRLLPRDRSLAVPHRRSTEGGPPDRDG